MATYSHAEVRELETELLYTPASLRKAHLQRLEKLIPELVPDRHYTYEYIFYRVSLFRPDTGADALLSGRGLRHGLSQILRRLSAAVPLYEASEDDPVVTVEAAATKCRVTLKTIRRWSALGLPVCCYILRDGLRAWGVRRSVLAQFLERRRAQARRPVRRVTDKEKQRILKKARALCQAGRISNADMVRKLAEAHDRSPATIRRVLQDEQRTQAAAQAAGSRRSSTSLERGEELARLYRAGMPVRALAKRFHRSTSAIYRLLHQALVERAMALDINYVPNPAFAGPEAEETCLGDEGLFTYPPEGGPHMAKAPSGLPPYLQELYRIPLLSRQREKELFRKYNYIKYRMAVLQEKIGRKGYQAKLLDQFEEHRQAAVAARRILIRCNLRLVVSIAKRHVGPLAQLLTLVSEGNMALIRAVECYDYGRNARLATYATWAISKHFARVVPEENYRFATFVTGKEEMLAAVGDARPDPHEHSESIAHLKTILTRATQHLTVRERTIIQSHFGTDGRPARTLEEIGKVFGLTRERIRQIEAKALEKLRSFVTPEALEALA